MTLNVNGYNSTFKKFADFAQQSIENGEKKAVANAGLEKTEGSKKKLTIFASKTDKVGLFLFRSRDEMRANDATREIFFKSVASMFGGAAKIPKKVLDALKLQDYGFGCPLSAHRIMVVKTAIDNYRAAQKGGLESPAQKGLEVMKAATAEKTEAAKKTLGADPDMQPLKIDKAKAKEMIANSCKLMGGAKLDKENTDFAVKCLKTYGNKLPAKTARLLANFIVNTAINDGMDEEAIENMAKDMKTWKEFDFGDPRLAKLAPKFIERQNNYVKEVLADPTMFSPENPDIFKQVYGDADRGNWTINGQTYKTGTDQKTVVDAFTSAVKAPNARKVVSSLLHQGALADLETLFNMSGALIGDAKVAILNEENLYELPGANMFIHRNAMRDGGIGILADADVRYGLSVSDNGKTATVTVSIDKHISSAGLKYDEYKLGMATISQQTTIDLTKEMPEVVGVTFKQTFTPDKIKLTGMHP